MAALDCDGNSGEKPPCLLKKAWDYCIDIEIKSISLLPTRSQSVGTEMMMLLLVKNGSNDPPAPARSR